MERRRTIQEEVRDAPESEWTYMVEPATGGRARALAEWPDCCADDDDNRSNNAPISISSCCPGLQLAQQLARMDRESTLRISSQKIVLSCDRTVQNTFTPPPVSTGRSYTGTALVTWSPIMISRMSKHDRTATGYKDSPCVGRPHKCFPPCSFQWPPTTANPSPCLLYYATPTSSRPCLA